MRLRHQPDPFDRTIRSRRVYEATPPNATIFCHADKKTKSTHQPSTKAPRFESLLRHSTGAVKKFKIDVRAAADGRPDVFHHDAPTITQDLPSAVRAMMNFW